MTRLADECRLFLTALMFFTRIPVRRGGYGPDRLADAARYFPWIGLLLGAMTAGIYLAALWLWAHPVAVLLSMIASLLFTGAFHEDGLADTVDGFGGGWEPTAVLRIMKDSRQGTYGVCALILALGLKFLLLAGLEPTLVPSALLIAHSSSRFVSGSLLRSLAYVRDDDTAKAKPLATRIGPVALLVSALPALAVLPLLGDPRMIAALALALLVVRQSCVRWFRRRIGGYTGDCLGAAQQLCELACYLMLGAQAWS